MCCPVYTQALIKLIKKYLLKGALSAAIVGVCAAPAYALNDQWYIGIGGTAGWLQPNPVEPGVGLENRLGTGGSVIIGRDLDDRSSLQLQIYSLGEAEIETGETVPYSAADGSLIYRIYDSRDTRTSKSGLALALYGRFALGYMNRDTDVPLINDAGVFFGAGGGAEVFFNDLISLRLEGLYHDQDAASATLALVTRFGGTRRARPAAPLIPTAPALPDTASTQTQGSERVEELPETYVPPSNASVPAANPAVVPPAAPQAAPPVALQAPAPQSAADRDSDGVISALDQCPDSAAGFPVRSNGCAMFDGVLSGLKFVPGTAQIEADSFVQLDYLANVLAEYPQARIELMAHTDDQGSAREQAILTRARLRSMGVYLVQQGVSAKRLILRSFGGSRPLYSNSTVEGRAGNNRIEVNEYLQ